MGIKRISFIFIILILGWVMFGEALYKENWRYNSLIEALEPVKGIIRSSSSISYMSNNSSLEIYYKTQNIMAPIVVVNHDIPFTEQTTLNDTVIFLEDLNNPAKQLDSLFSIGYKQVTNHSTPVYRIHILKK